MNNNNLQRTSGTKPAPHIANKDFEMWLTRHTPEFRVRAIKHSILDALEEMGITEKMVLNKALIQISLCCKVYLKRISPPTSCVNRLNENSSENSSNVKRNYHIKYNRTIKTAIRDSYFSEQRLKIKQKFEKYKNHFKNRCYSSTQVRTNSGGLKHKTGIDECLDERKHNDVTEDSLSLNSPESKTTVIRLKRKESSDINEEECTRFEKYKIKVQNTGKRKFYQDRINSESSDESDNESYYSRSRRKFERKCKRKIIESSDESDNESYDRRSRRKSERKFKRKIIESSDESDYESHDRKSRSRRKSESSDESEYDCKESRYRKNRSTRKLERKCKRKIISSDESEIENVSKCNFKRNCKRKIESSGESEIENQEKREFLNSSEYKFQRSCPRKIDSSDESEAESVSKPKSLQSELESNSSKTSDSQKISNEINSNSNEFLKSCNERFNNIMQASKKFSSNSDKSYLNISLPAEPGKIVSSKNSTNVTISHKNLSLSKSDPNNYKHETIIVKLYEDEKKDTVKNVKPLTLHSNLDNVQENTDHKPPNSEVNDANELSDLEEDTEDCEIISIPESPSPENNVEDSEVIYIHDSPNPESNVDGEVKTSCESRSLEEECEVISVQSPPSAGCNVEDGQIKSACESFNMQNNIEECEVISLQLPPSAGCNVEDSQVKSACETFNMQNNKEECEVISVQSPASAGCNVEDSQVKSSCESLNNQNNIEECEVISVKSPASAGCNVEDSQVKSSCVSLNNQNNIEECEVISVQSPSSSGNKVNDSQLNTAFESHNLENNREEYESPNLGTNVENSEIGKVHDSPDLGKNVGESKVGKIWVRDISTLMASPVSVKEKEVSQPSVCESSENVKSTVKIPKYILEGYSKPDIHFMKLYKLQFNELVDSKIEIMSGLLHIGITDYICKEGRLKWADKLLTEKSVATERQRIDKEYWYNMRQRGIEFTALFGSIISRFEDDCVKEMFFALYARLIESLLKIDTENTRHLHLSRDLISAMLLRNNYRNKIIIGLLQENNEEFQKMYCKFKSLLNICNSYFAADDGKVHKFDPVELERQQIVENISVSTSKISEINNTFGNKLVGQENGTNSSRTDKESSVSSLKVSFIPQPNTVGNKDAPSLTVNHQNCSKNKATDGFENIKGSTVKECTILDHAYAGNNLGIKNNSQNKNKEDHNIPKTQVTDITQNNKANGLGQIFESLDLWQENTNSSNNRNIPEYNLGVVFPMSIDPLALNARVNNLNTDNSLRSVFSHTSNDSQVTDKTGLNQLSIKQTSEKEKTMRKISIPASFFKDSAQNLYKMHVPNNSIYLNDPNNSTGRRVIVRKVSGYPFPGLKANGRITLPQEVIAQGSETSSRSSQSCLLTTLPSNSLSSDGPSFSDAQTIYISTNQQFKKTVPTVNQTNANNIRVSPPQTVPVTLCQY